MAAAPPHLEQLPASFPIFPLAGALLLPRGRLPLNIFEPRYLALVEDALGLGRMFGMIQPDPHRPSGPAGPATYRIGCLGRMTAFSETEDGRYLITLDGLVRFAVAEELPMRRGYRRVRGDLGPFAADLAAPPGEPCGDRAALLAALRPYFSRHGIAANWDAIDALQGEALLTTLCMVCPFQVAEKQALLEAPTPAERAAALRTLLAIDSHARSTDQPARAS